MRVLPGMAGKPDDFCGRQFWGVVNYAATTSSDIRGLCGLAARESQGPYAGHGNGSSRWNGRQSGMATVREKPFVMADLADPSFVWGAIVTAGAGAFAALRWLFRERSEVLRERSVFHGELTKELRRISRHVENLEAAQADLALAVERERQLRFDAEHRAHQAGLAVDELTTRLDRANAEMTRMQETIKRLREICRKHGLDVDIPQER